ncbi:hypothetical protein LJR143_001655 [Pseudoxanthomonas sp. LjRoot143]|uniref:hypothetical protein n=1 Tax=Pseudoxanthomonas sp. LjRoot143 TaxID=3342266 RepID=UPI003ECFCC19
MSMTQLQRDALARAKAGDWELADAMELVERSRNGHAPRAVIEAAIVRGLHIEDFTLTGGVFDSGRLRLIGYGNNTCHECEGEGTVTCTPCKGEGEVVCPHCNVAGDCKVCDGGGSVECETCDGQGCGDGPLSVFADLNDTPLPESSEPNPKATTRPISWVRKTLAAYHTEQQAQREPDKAAAKTLENA